MRHKTLFFSLSFLLLASTGGVFALMNHETNLPDVKVSAPTDVLVAGVAVHGEKKIAKEPRERVRFAPEPKIEPRTEPIEAPAQELPPEPVPPPPHLPSAPLPVREPRIITEIVDVFEEAVEEKAEFFEEVVQEPAVSPPDPAPQQAVGQSQDKININTASATELQELNGIGKVLSQRIVDYRNREGLFRRIGHVQNVKGIGPSTFEKVRNSITVGSVVMGSNPPPQPPPSPPPPSGTININTASYEQLQDITGVGPAIAQRIIDYRAIQRFQTIEEIKNVKGIGEKTFEKMKNQITAP